ncbi:MAG TPA: DUF423 domain-containing protein [Flavobacteriaceae bacterium]|nr:DUF423 domain-containing protein [Flavobacteriaceae bacterium]
MNKIILVTASILGMLAIVLGAFAAHGLKELISAESLKTFETGVRYQMYHAIVLLFIGITSLFSTKTKRLLYYTILIGVIFFSGSIYGLATNELSGFDFKSIAFVTPIGGLLLIASWAIMLLKFLRVKFDK